MHELYMPTPSHTLCGQFARVAQTREMAFTAQKYDSRAHASCARHARAPNSPCYVEPFRSQPAPVQCVSGDAVAVDLLLLFWQTAVYTGESKPGVEKWLVVVPVF